MSVSSQHSESPEDDGCMALAKGSGRGTNSSRANAAVCTEQESPPTGPLSLLVGSVDSGFP